MRAVDPGDVGAVERELWLKAQVAVPSRLLPGDRADGRPVPTEIPPVLVLQPADIPAAPSTAAAADVADAEATEAEDAEEADVTESAVGPLICPLDVRPRAAAALVGFLTTATATLREATLGLPEEKIRARTTVAMADTAGGAVHVVSSTWTVPLPWFALVDPAARQLTLAPQDDPARRVCWHTPIGVARERCTKAYDITHESLGDGGPARMLQETGRWLEHFHDDSVVELDYGGLVQLLDDETLLADTSADDVQHALAALADDDADEVADRYARLQDFWSELAGHERLG